MVVFSVLGVSLLRKEAQTKKVERVGGGKIRNCFEDNDETQVVQQLKKV